MPNLRSAVTGGDLIRAILLSRRAARRPQDLGTNLPPAARERVQEAAEATGTPSGTQLSESLARQRALGRGWNADQGGVEKVEDKKIYIAGMSEHKVTTMESPSKCCEPQREDGSIDAAKLTF